MSRVSVIIPTYNRRDTILDSVNSVLNQTRSVDEILVVDDGSTDDTASLVGQLGDPVRFIGQANAGSSAARNVGILNSSADYVMFLDSDDLLHPDAVRELAGALDGSSDSGASYCGWKVMDAQTDTVSLSPLGQPSGDLLQAACRDHLFIVSSVMVRRDCIAKSGLFDVELKQFEDVDFWIRVASVTQFVFVAKHLVVYRRSGAGASSNYSSCRAMGERVLKKLNASYGQILSDRNAWNDIEYRFLGVYGRELTRRAFASYESGDFRNALRASARALLYDVRIRRNRGMWSILVKSFCQSMRTRKVEKHG